MTPAFLVKDRGAKSVFVLDPLGKVKVQVYDVL